MAKIGYKLMSEEHPPSALVRNAVRAERAGFDFAAISDHFSPWVEEQGHAPMVWPILGAIANATDHVGLMTAVTCPIMRYHPAVVAQFAATVSLLSDGRFSLGLGSGERLNEHVVGEGWPGVPERQERLAEATNIIQLLLAGGFQRFDGVHYQLDHARLYDVPSARPPVLMAAGGPNAAQLAADLADGLIASSADAELVKVYKDAGGSGPRYGEIALCYGDDEETAKKTAHKYFRWSTGGWPVQAELPNTKAFEAASKHITPDQLAQTISCGPSLQTHLDAIGKFTEHGFDHVIIVQIGPDQDAFFDFFEAELRPALMKEIAGATARA